MRKKRELLFWRCRCDDGLLIAALRSHRDRAIRFFGAVSVLTENEQELYRTLEAHKIASASADDLLEQMNAVVPVGLRSDFRFTEDQISSMKKHANERLAFVLGREGSHEA